MALVGVLLVAALLRLLHWWSAHDQPFVGELAMDSQEYDRWAREILGGEVLGREVFFQAPLYPYFVAALYRLFGASVQVVYLAQIALAVGGVYALFRAGTALRDRALGLAAAALLACYPTAIAHDALLLKESLAVSLTCFLLWMLLAAWNDGQRRAAFLAGLAAGLLCLLRENVLLLLPVLAVLALGPRGRRSRRAALLFALGALLPLAPVALRNGARGGSFLPTTFQGGVNFWIGNNPAADGTYRPLVRGKQVPAEERAESVRLAEQETGHALRPGEVSAHWLSKSLHWAATEPAAFALLQVRKFGLFWSWYEWPDAVDVAYLRARSPVLRWPWIEFGGLCVLALAGFLIAGSDRRRFIPVFTWIVGSAATTILFFLFSRYRLLTVPGLMLLAAVPVAALLAALRSGRLKAAAGLGCLLLVAVVAPHIGAAPVRQDLLHYNLGRLHQEAGRLDAARDEYRAALVANPGDFLACLNLGTLAARDRQYAEAEAWFERAAALAPDSDDAAANLGSSALALGDLETADRALSRALELNPRNLFALHSGSLLRLRQGRIDEARALNARLLALAPEHAQGRALHDRLLSPTP